MKKKKLKVGSLLLLISVILLMSFCTKKNGSQFSGKQSSGHASAGGASVVAVQVVPVSYGPVIEKREFSGTVKAAYSYVIAAKVSGHLSKLSKRIGEKTGANEVVGKIDDTEYRQAVQEAAAQVAVSKASVKESEAQLAFAEKEMQRIKELVDKGVSSQAELDAIETQYNTQKSRFDLAQAQLAQREASLALARTRLDYTSIRSAQAGYVAVRHTDGGALLSVNSPVLTIVGIDTVYVVVSISERDYSHISKGQQALIRVEALPGREFTGTVSSISPLFQTETRTAIVEISVTNDSLLLKPGMFARIEIILAKKDSAQIVPLTSVVNRNGKEAVFLASDSGKAHLMPVKTGIIDGDKVEVLHPILNGNVVTIGNHLLIDGSKISSVNSKTPKEGSSVRKKNENSSKEVKK
jgi:RND family efflux transporter MFP subunit